MNTELEDENVYFKLSPQKYQELGMSHFNYMDVGEEPKGIRKYNHNENSNNIAVKLQRLDKSKALENRAQDKNTKPIVEEVSKVKKTNYELDFKAEPLQYGSELRNVKIEFKKFKSQIKNVINDIEMVDQNTGYVNFLGKGVGRFTLRNGEVQIKMLVECKFFIILSMNSNFLSVDCLQPIHKVLLRL